ncbi:MAG: hypothetical protein JOY59_06250, partial [Candidatus Eremiobacteraeota bacterium]|nr:hypothetical protein [Candidatus Eremiobacteraeota bacterium]
WGMSPDDVSKIIADGIHVKFVEAIKKEPDIYKQDQLRKDEQEEIQKVKDSFVKFEEASQPSTKAWATSIVQSEFAPKNDESMMTMWEKDQRRFLFFWHDKLYKQFIAFNSEHPAFQGKSFDDFAKLIEKRFGPAEMKFANLRTKDEQTLDHLEWAPAGDEELWAIDQSQFYGNFCLVLKQRGTAAQVARARGERSPRQANGNALIDSVTSPEKVQGDPNSDIVDQITGKTAKGTPGN